MKYPIGNRFITTGGSLVTIQDHYKKPDCMICGNKFQTESMFPYKCSKADGFYNWYNELALDSWMNIDIKDKEVPGDTT